MPTVSRRLLVVLSGCLSLLSSAAFAQANAGVSDERVSLPQAPGSVSGVGENASTEGNQGALQYNVEIEVPPGFAGLTPQVSLSYASTSGTSVVGVGWAMPTFSIERMTVRGLQKYDLTDRFAVDGAAELVKVSAASTPIYRARFESGFVRYSWLNAGTGDAGYWKAEYPDGRIGYFGADKTGTPVTTAQVVVPATTNVYRWHLVLIEDQWGHQMKYSWTKDSSGTPLLERIDYLYEGNLPRHSVRFTYENRTDILSDAKPGFELKLTKRLLDVRVFSGTTAPEQVRKYVLEYETDQASGFTTRLKSVSRLGRGDVAYPVKFGFGYSQTLGGACATNCDKPFVTNMGMVSGVDFSTGKATMVDINGDALPDVVFSDAQGRHSFIYAKLDSEGKASFMGTPVQSSRTTGSSPFILGDPRTQLLDVNGDGFVDITQAKAPAVLCNNGSGDWVEASACTTSAPPLPNTYDPEDDAADSAQQDPKYVRFFDYDNDKRIDWLRTPSGNTTTEVLVNVGSGFAALTVDTIGATFDESPLELADMNGDGLQDPVQMLVSGATVVLQYKLNLGFGHWSSTWRDITLTGLDASQAAVADLEDINGDGLADVVAVTGNEVSIALNRNGDTFAPLLTLTSATLSTGAIPNRSSNTTVTYADMNGNGSADIVWFQPDGSAQYLELFPVRPNLISRIENGIGAVQLISYGTSIAEQARDALAQKPWPNRVPNASVVVTKIDSFVTLTGSDTGGLHERFSFRYHAGYYDGTEKMYRGYETVERELLSNLATDSMEPGLVVLEFDVGKMEPAFAGRTLKQQAYALNQSTQVLLREDRTLYALCPLTDVMPAVKFVCNRATTTILAERDVANARTVRMEREYDGYGNVSKETALGVTMLGTPESPRACEACVASGLYGKPCGDMCVGDEQVTELSYIVPGADTGQAWLLNKLKRVASGATASSLGSETRTYYDGPDYQGLPYGQLSKGGISRISRRVGSGDTAFIDVSRVKRDASGNALEELAPNASTPTGERRAYTYEPAGLWASTVEVKLSATRSLKRDLAYDSAFELLSQASNWYATNSGTPASTPQQTRYRYDEHGRLFKVLDPGDTDATASTEYQYTLANPASRIVALERSSATSGQDAATATCLDGKGRAFQTRRKVNDTTWQVSGFTEFDSRGAEARVFLPYTSGSGACEMAPPQGVPFMKKTYDMLGRMLSEVEPDGTVRRYEYGPLSRKSIDEEERATLEELDGLNRLVRMSRTNPDATTQVSYDALGNLFTVTDPLGHQHVQVYDPMGRMTQLTDTNWGVTNFEYDKAGNQTRRVDARSKAVRTQYDALNRIVAQYDEADEANTKVSWVYDAVEGCTDCTNAGGEVVQIDWLTGQDRYGYDTTGNLVFHQRTVGGHPLITRHRYDGLDRKTASLYPAGLTVEHRYDGASRVSSMPGFVTQVEYSDRDELKAVTFVNGVKTQYEYDTKLDVSRQWATTADQQAIFDLHFTRDRRGDITSITDQGQREGRARHGAAFVYDGWSRVTQATLDREGDAEVLSFSYDAIDNIVSQTSSLGATSRAHLGDYTYDATKANAVTKAGHLDYGYDSAGFMVSRGSSAYEYDHLGRLTKATRNGTETGSFAFGPGYDRVVKQEGDSTTWYVSDNFEVRDGIAVVYAELGDTKVARAQSDALAATLLSDLAPATGSGTLTPAGDSTIDIADAWLAQAASAGAISLSGGPTPSPTKALLASAARRLLIDDVTWLHEDHLQSVVASTNASGAVVAEQSFYPYGEQRSQTGYVDEYGFTGKERDSSTGLTHYPFRELDPIAGRWARVDPAFAELTPGSLRYLGSATTGYAYAANDFANNIDPAGLWPWSKSAKQGSSSNLKKQNSQKNANQKKGWTREQKVRAFQAAIAVVSVVMSIVGASLSYEGTSSVGADGVVHMDNVAGAGTILSLAATTTSGLGTLVGATYDTQQAFKSKAEDDPKAAPTTQAAAPAAPAAPAQAQPAQPAAQAQQAQAKPPVPPKPPKALPRPPSAKAGAASVKPPPLPPRPGPKKP